MVENIHHHVFAVDEHLIFEVVRPLQNELACSPCLCCRLGEKDVFLTVV